MTDKKNSMVDAVESARKQAKFPTGEGKLSPKLAAVLENIVRCTDDGKYYFRMGNRWQKAHGSAEINRTLRMEYGIKSKKKDGEVSEVDRILHHCFKNNSVCLAFQSICGYKAGIHRILGKKILCLEEMPLIEPEPVSCGTIMSFLRCFTDHEHFPEQLDLLLSWLSVQTKDLYAIYRNSVPILETRPVGQALFLIGPSGGGKSFFANQILKAMFSGIVADPFQFLNNRDNRFNSELFSSPLLLCDDAIGSPKNEDRKAQAQKLKGLMSGSPIRYEAKGKEALSITPHWRIVYLMNDDEYSFNAFPDTIDGFRERVIALKVGCEKWTEFDKENRESMISMIGDEIPGFIDFLLNYEIPKNVRHERFRCKSYLHGDIEKASFERTAEAMLRNAILDIVGEGGGEYTAKELMLTLKNNPDYSLPYLEKMSTDAFGRKISTLCILCPAVIKKTGKRSGNAFLYAIFPPREERWG